MLNICGLHLSEYLNLENIFIKFNQIYVEEIISKMKCIIIIFAMFISIACGQSK